MATLLEALEVLNDRRRASDPNTEMTLAEIRANVTPEQMDRTARAMLIGTGLTGEELDDFVTGYMDRKGYPALEQDFDPGTLMSAVLAEGVIIGIIFAELDRRDS